MVFFAGRRGLRQCDPISSLLFVLVMEYLSRALQIMSQFPYFKYHPMCKKLKLRHLIFANDLMIFQRKCGVSESSDRKHYFTSVMLLDWRLTWINPMST